MRKSHAFNILSDTSCITPSCDKKIKLRLVKATQKPRRCFKCHKRVQAARGHFIKRVRFEDFKKFQ